MINNGVAWQQDATTFYINNTTQIEHKKQHICKKTRSLRILTSICLILDLSEPLKRWPLVVFVRFVHAGKLANMFTYLFISITDKLLQNVLQGQFPNNYSTWILYTDLYQCPDTLFNKIYSRP